MSAYSLFSPCDWLVARHKSFSYSLFSPCDWLFARHILFSPQCDWPLPDRGPFFCLPQETSKDGLKVRAQDLVERDCGHAQRRAQLIRAHICAGLCTHIARMLSTRHRLAFALRAAVQVQGKAGVAPEEWDLFLTGKAELKGAKVTAAAAFLGKRMGGSFSVLNAIRRFKSMLDHEFWRKHVPGWMAVDRFKDLMEVRTLMETLNPKPRP